MQAELPFLRDARRVPVGSELRVEAELDEAGARLRLTRGRKVVAALRIQLTGEPELATTLGGNWDFLPGGSAEGDTPELLALFAQQAHAWGAQEPGAAEAVVARVRAHLQRRADPLAARAAAPFRAGRGLQWFVYECAAADPLGRVRQLAKTCPGLLIAAHCFAERGQAPEAAHLLEGIRSGTRLDRLLDLAAGGSKAQRLRLRRAGPAVPGWVLALPPPAVLIPEDIPRDPADNALWYLAMATDLLCAPPPSADEEHHRRFVSFVSRHGLELFRSAEADRVPFETLLRGLWAHLQASRRVPSRASDPAGLAADAQPYVEAFALHPRLYALDLPLPPAQRLRAAMPAGSGLRVRVLTRPSELLREGATMRHCLGTQLLGALERAYCHAELDGAKLTFAVDETEAGYALGEVSGPHNAEPTGGQLEALLRWVSRVNEAAAPVGFASTRA